jgi:KaiC/GvpD/RAD55 family RecA-like ATPase
MVSAEEKASSELFLESSQFFEKAKKFSITKKTSLLLSGNSSFCKGMAASFNYQNTLDLKIHKLAKGHMKTAANYYLKAGFQTASEHAKATQRLFDAYLYLNNAETETDPEKCTKFYRMAEKVLLISLKAFNQAKQIEKGAEVKRILEKVKEEKELAISLNEVFHAPTMASTTLSFATPIHTNGDAVGLERFEHANIQSRISSNIQNVILGQNVRLEISFINIGKECGQLINVKSLMPKDFIIVEQPENVRIENGCLDLKGKTLSYLKSEDIQLIIRPIIKGNFHLKPKVQYLDDLGNPRIHLPESLMINVEEVVMENRLETGSKELDTLLLGGIPEEYSVALTGPPIDERQRIIEYFLKTGIQNEQITFYVTTEIVEFQDNLKNPNFVLFLCNPKPKGIILDLPNLYHIKSKTDLTNLSIYLSKAIKKIDETKKKRICLETISDVLLDYGAKETRKWVAELITDLGSRGFTMLAILDPGMHTNQETNSVLNLFDGEIEITQIEDPLECKTSLRVKKLRNQDYIKNPICLT